MKTCVLATKTSCSDQNCVAICVRVWSHESFPVSHWPNAHYASSPGRREPSCCYSTYLIDHKITDIQEAAALVDDYVLTQKKKYCWRCVGCVLLFVMLGNDLAGSKIWPDEPMPGVPAMPGQQHSQATTGVSSPSRDDARSQSCWGWLPSCYATAKAESRFRAFSFSHLFSSVWATRRREGGIILNHILAGGEHITAFLGPRLKHDVAARIRHVKPV